jgi:hypothetical protein
MAANVDSINRKMFKGIIASVLEPGEQVELLDVGTSMSATELADFSKKAIKDVYKRAIIASPTIAAGAPRAGKRMAKGGYADKFDEIDRYGVLVTNKAIRVIPVRTRSKAFGVDYVPRDDLPAVTFPRDAVSLELGAQDETKFYGQTSRTIEVAMHAEGFEPVVLKMGNVDGWRALVGE